MGIVNAIRCFQRQFKKKRHAHGEMPSALAFFSKNQSRSKALMVGNDDPTISSGKESNSITVKSENVEHSFYASFSEVRQYEQSLPNERITMTAIEDMTTLFENLNTVIHSLPFHCEVAVEIDGSVPSEIMIHDLLLFPLTLHMLTHCLSQSRLNTPPELNKCALHIDCRKQGRSELLVRCLQAGRPMDVKQAKELFADTDTLLGQVAIMVRSLGGHWGMYHGTWNAELTSSSTTQSLFWFRIPYDPVNYRNPLLENDLKEIHPSVGMIDIASVREEFLESVKLEAAIAERSK